VSRILIVEDDAFKLDAILEIVGSVLVGWNIDVCRSVQSAVKAVSSVDYKIVILDMSLPSHDLELGLLHGIPVLSGGVEVLFELNYRGAPSDVVVVTQYPEIEMSGRLVPLEETADFISKSFGIIVSKCIYFDPDQSAWRRALHESLTEWLKR